MHEWREDIRSRLTGLALSPEREAEIIEEFEQHLADRHAELLADGTSDADARRQVLDELETSDLLRASMRPLRQASTPEPVVPGSPGRRFFADIRRDVTFGVRLLRRQPAFSAIAVLVLAVGIGANTTAFSILNVLLLKPRVGGVDGQITGIYARQLANRDSYREFSWDEFATLRERTDLFASVTGHAFGLVGFQNGGATRRLFADIVTAEYFDTFGVAPIVGRAFTRDEERPGAEIRVVILSYGFWQRLGGSPGLIGQSITLNSRSFTIVGVAPRGFGGSMAMVTPDVWVPTGVYDLMVFDARNEGAVVSLVKPDTQALIVVARLHDADDIAAVSPALGQAGHQVFDASPGDSRDYELELASLSRMSVSARPQVDDELTGFMSVLLALGFVVLLIASFNLANMLLARGRARMREFAIRAALGGSRRRLIRQLLAENLVLATTGAVAGLLVSTLGLRLILLGLPATLPISLSLDVNPDVRVIAATALFAFVATLLFGLAPAWRFARENPATNLKALPSDLHGRRRWLGFSTGNLLMAGQVALTFVMLTAAGLFVSGALEAAHSDPGFSLERGIMANLDTTFNDLSSEQSRAFYHEALTRLRALPGVESASLASYMPFGIIETAVNVRRPDAPENGSSSTSISIGNDYFETMGMAVLAGRDFTETESLNESGEPVVLIDEILARHLFGGTAAVGQFVQTGGTTGAAVVHRVVGVVSSFRGDLFDEAPRPAIYFPFGLASRANMYLHARTSASTPDDERGMLGVVRAMLSDIAPDPPIVSLETRADFREGNILLAVVRAGAMVFLALGVAALFLAAVGVYGVKSYLVARRTQEIGVRVALGAQPRDIIWMVLRDGLVLVSVAAVMGAALSMLTGAAMRPILFQGRALDLPLVALAAVTLAAAILLACWLPARRGAPGAPPPDHPAG